MKLPQISTPEYELELPSNNKKIIYRPYLAQEEKILLMAKESKKPEDIATSLIKIVSNCTKGIDDVRSLALCDFEYMFVKLRAKSSGESAMISLKCSECGAHNEVAVDLDTIEPTIQDIEHKIILEPSQGIGICMKYPTVAMMLDKELSSSSVLSTADMIRHCLDYVYDAEKTYPASESTREELDEFLNKLSFKMLEEVKSKFFDKMPKLSKTIEYTCTECGAKNTYTLEGISDFF